MESTDNQQMHRRYGSYLVFRLHANFFIKASLFDWIQKVSTLFGWLCS